MSYSKFRRLLFVSLVPLLIAGVVLSLVTSPNRKLASILCEPSVFGQRENCRNVGGIDTHLYSIVKNNHPSWFDVRPDYESRFIDAHVEATGRLLTGAKIQRAVPFSGHPTEVTRRMNELIGDEAVVALGMNGASPLSLSIDGFAHLACSSLFYNSDSDIYESQCYGDGWSGMIEYTVPRGSSIEGLHLSILEEINSLERELLIHWVIATFIPFISFLLLSFFIFLIFKAYGYVKKG